MAFLKYQAKKVLDFWPNLCIMVTENNKRGNNMKNTVKIELTHEEIQVISGVFYQYYQILNEKHMCEVEEKCEKSITYKLVEAEREIERNM